MKNSPTYILVSLLCLFAQLCFSQNDFKYQFCSTGEYATVTAPQGFSTYDWSDGQSGRTIKINKNQMDQPINCRMTCPMGCDKSLSTVVFSNNFNPSPTQIFGKNPSCHEAEDGKINLKNSTVGVGPFSYRWNDGMTSKNRKGLNGGLYTVTITDQLGCEEVLDIELFEPELLEANTVSTFKTDATCHGSSNGTAQVKINSGSISSYSYEWNNGATTPSINNLQAKEYSVKIRKGKKCRQEKITVNEPAPISVQLLSVGNYHGYDVSCHGQKDGKIKLKVAGGSGNYMVNWNNSQQHKISPDSTLLFKNLAANNYNITIKDDNGCIAYATTILKSPAPISVTPQISQYDNYQISCRNSNDGFVKLNTAGGSGVYEYLWTKDSTIVSNNENLENVTAGKYAVQIIDSNGCKSKAKFRLRQPRKLGATKKTIKINRKEATIKIKPQGGTGAHYVNGKLVKKSIKMTVQLPFKEPIIITDENGCEAEKIWVINQPINYPNPKVKLKKRKKHNGDLNDCPKMFKNKTQKIWTK